MQADVAIVDVSGEWSAACEVQRRFMHFSGSASDVLDCAGGCRQLKDLGGDFYEFWPLEQDRLAFAVGDASGKGLPAALMIANVQSSLRTAMLLAGDDAPGALRAVNRQVYEASLADRYATLFYGVIDRRNRVLRYVNAGHNPPMLIRADGSMEWLETGGAPVGMFGDCLYTEGVVRLNAGDRIVVYTDGVTEAVNPGGEEWGVEEFGRAAVECRAGDSGYMVRSLFRSMDEFSQGCQADDATIAALWVQ